MKYQKRIVGKEKKGKTLWIKKKGKNCRKEKRKKIMGKDIRQKLQERKRKKHY